MRGICCLVPNIKGVSENIRVISVLGRYLEHSRIYYFHNGGKEELYLGSADLMQRNLNHRVEVVFPVEDAGLMRYLRDNVLGAYFKDNSGTRLMQSDGTDKLMHPKDGEDRVNVQDWLMTRPWMKKS